MLTVPESGFRNDAASEAIVVLPEPELPTSAVMVSAGASRLTSCSTVCPSW